MAQGQAAPRVSDSYRWLQLTIGVICMVMIANYQYGWTFFVPEIEKKFGWSRAEIQIAFTLFVLFETWLVPIEGWFVDKYGPKIVIFISGILCAMGWWMTSKATTLGGIDGYYSAMIICGIGAGGVYGTCVGNSLKWFPDKRGLAAGITAAGFGAGSALTVAPIQNMIKASGFQDTFLFFGIGQGVIICLLAAFIAGPKAGQVPPVTTNANVIQTRRQFAPNEIIGENSYWIAASIAALVVGLGMWASGNLFYFPGVLALMIFTIGGVIVWTRGQPIFTLMYFMFTLVGAGGLIVTANLATIAADLKVAKEPVTLFGYTMAALTFAATIDRILNGLTRPFFGWISDNIGRENTMFVAFLMEGIGIYALYKLGSDPVWFVLLSGFVFFAWGEIYSLFPSTSTDTFGSKYAATNAGLLYTAKGTAALVTPYASSLQKATSSWDGVFLIAAGANILAAVLALFVLKPWRARVIANSVASPADEAEAAAETAAASKLGTAGALQAAGAAGAALTAGAASMAASLGGNAASASAAAHAHAAGAPNDLTARLAAAEDENRRLRQIAAETKAILNKV
jgi:MFS transporter, OFA family, oxalate/formate antiporter